MHNRLWRPVFVWLCAIGVLAGSTQAQPCPSPAEIQARCEAIKQQDNPAQIRLLSQLSQQLRQHCRPDSSRATVAYELGRVQYIAGQYATAAQNFRESIWLNRQPGGNPTGQIKSYCYLALIQQAQGDQAGAFRYYVACVRLGKHYGAQPRTIATALNNLSFMYQQQGDYQRALNTAREGIYYARQSRDSLLEARSLSEAARDLMQIGHPEKGVPLIDKAIRIAQYDKANETLYYFFTIIKAQILSDLGYIDPSLTLQKKALDYYLASHQAELAAHLYGNIGYLLMMKRKEYRKAMQYFQQAYQLHSDPYQKARILNNMGGIYALQGNYPPALRHYQLALRLLPIGVASADPRINPSDREMVQAIDKEYLLTLMQDKADAWLAYAKTTGNHRQRLQYALATYHVADRMIDRMRWEQTGQQSKLYWRQKTRAIYEQAIETCYRLNNPAQAFHFFEKSRAVMLADKLNELGARQQLSKPQVAEQLRLEQAVSQAQSRLATIAPDSAVYAPAQTGLLAEQERLDAFRKKLEATNPTYYRYKYDSTTTSLADLQQNLKARHASFLTYFVGDSALYVMGVTDTGATFRRQPVLAYAATVQAFRQRLETPAAMSRTADVADFREHSHALYRQLLAPFALPAGRVIVSSDGVSIPFEALSRSTRPNDYALADYAFSYVYSARLLLRDRPGAKQTSALASDFLGVAPVNFSPSLQQGMLAGSDAALRSIAGRFGESTLLTQQQATRRSFQAMAPHYRIIHLFTHATADSSGREPLLYFADSTLQLSDLGEGALPNAQLVVLAACKTGVGANQRGEGVFSLARGFAALGVPSVLTTLWSVENKATYDITNLFYQYLDQGMAKDVALQRAKQDWLSTAGRANQLPNYWAGLILVGDAEPMNYPIHGGWWAAGGLLLLLALAGSWWRFRHRPAAPPTPAASSPLRV